MTDHARRVLRDIEALQRAARRCLGEHRQVCAEVGMAATPLRRRAAREWLRSVPVARLKQVADGPFRLGPVQGAEFVSVADVLDSTPDGLRLLRGIGPQTARRLHTAATGLAETAASLRIEIGPRDEAAAPLVVALHRLVNASPDLPRAVAFAERVEETFFRVIRDARRAVWWRRVFLPPYSRYLAWDAIVDLAELLQDRDAAPLMSPDLVGARVPADEAWRDFERNADDYHAELADAAGLASDGEAAEGFMPEALAVEVWGQPLDDTYLEVSLRDYQSFGARFALLRRRVILGDEPGLGRAIQAIAAIAHRRAEGATHFLVACPASVLLNWVRDIETCSSIDAHLLYGPGRDAALETWFDTGGIAVTALDSLPCTNVPPGLTARGRDE